MNIPAYAKETLLLGIDGTQKVTGIAWLGVSRLTGRAVVGTEQIDDILDSKEAEELFRDLSEELVFSKVWVAVEYPRWNAGASQVVRAAANSYVRLIKRVFPKAEVVKIDPNKWQGFFSFKARPQGLTTKDYSLWLADKAYGWPVGKSHDRADASLLVEYLKANPPPEKPKRTKNRP